MPANQSGYSATQHLEDLPHYGLTSDNYRAWADGRRLIPPHVVAKYQANALSGAMVITKPQHVKRGTLAIMVGATRGAGNTWNVPTGWTELYPQQGASDTSPGLCAMYRVLTEDDDSVTSYTFTHVLNDSNKIAHVLFVEAADPYSPFAYFNYVYNTGTVSTVPDFHVPAVDCLVLCFGVSSTSNNTLTPIFTFGTPFTKDMFELNVGSNRQSISHGWWYPSASSDSSKSDFLGWTTGASITSTNENPEAVHVMVIQPPLYSY